MSAVPSEAQSQYRVQAYKQVPGSQPYRCLSEEADHFWIERRIGPDRWQGVEKRDTEAQAYARLAEITAAPIEKTHYGYSTPRR